MASRGRVFALLLDIAAGRPVELHRPLTEEELELAVHHGLMGLMADHENPHLRTAALPIYARLEARHGVMRTHLRRVLERMHENGVKATVVKGLHLASWAYRNPMHRTTTDIDLLVPASQVEREVEILAADEAVTTVPPQTPKADKRHIPFLDSDTGVRFTLDLHWDLFSYTQLRGCADGATDWAWDHATFVEDHPLGPLWELPEEVRISFLCTHALLDHRFRLILFRDLGEVAAGEPDWRALIDFAAQWHLRSTTYLALLMAAGICGAGIATASLTELRTGLVTIPYIERKLTSTDVVRFDGHRLHPLNLATVLVHDDRRERIRLAAEAPFAFPEWWRRAGSISMRRTTSGAKTPLSVTMLVSSNRRRGAEVFGERLARGLEERGWTVDFVALEDTGESPAVPAITLGDGTSGARLDLNLVRQLRRRIRRTKPRIVFANGGATLRYAAAALAGVRDAPKLVYASIGEPAYWLRSDMHRRVQAILHRRADEIFAVSSMTRSQLLEIFGLDEARVHVAHTGIPPSFFDTPHAAPGDELRLAFLGNLSPEKGPGTALQIAAHLGDSHAVRLRFIGTGPLLRDLEADARAAGIEDHVEFVGSVDDVRPHLAWADLLLLTSQTEGFPGVVLEAAATATPSVVFDVGGTRETVVDGVTGVVVPAGDTAAFLAAVGSLASDRGRIVRMGEAAHGRARESFLLDHAIDRHDELLREILGVAPDPQTAPI